MHFIRTSVLIVWAVSVVGVIVVSLKPAVDVDMPFPHWDKVAHCITYAWLGFLPAVGLLGKRSIVVGAGAMVVLGMLLEWGQSFLPDRMASLGDVLANTVGVFLGLFMANRVLNMLVQQPECSGGK